MSDSISPRKVAIVGSSPTSRDEAPYDDLAWEIWTLNDMAPIIPRLDRLFEIHTPRLIEQFADSKQDQLSWMKANTTVPIYMVHPDPDLYPASIPYPLDTITKQFGTYLTSTVSYMLALAIHEGVDELAIYGVDMAHGTEYAAQRPSCEFFIGWARGAGIPVYIPRTSDLLNCRSLYGQDDSLFSVNMQVRYQQLVAERNGIQHKRIEAQLNEAKLDGAIEILSYVRAAWDNGT